MVGRSGAMLGRLVDGFEAFASEDLRHWSDDSLRAALGEAERMVGRLRSVQARLLAELDQRDIATREGAASPAAWLRRELGLSGEEASRRVDEAVAVAASIDVADALQQGQITPEHVRTIGRTLRAEPGVSVAELLAHARASDAGQFARQARRLRREHQLDAGLSEFEAQRVARRCAMWVRAEDGMVILRGEFDPVDGARLQAKLLTQAERLWRQDRPGAGAPSARTTPQRLADALVLLCTQGPTGPASGDPPPAGVPPVAEADGPDERSIGHRGGGDGRPAPSAGGGTGCDAASVRGGIGSGPALDGVEVLVALDYETLVSALPGTAEIVGVGPIPAETARRLACGAGLIPVVLGGAGEPLDLGRSRRLANRAQRRALKRHHRHCAWTGCTVPFDWCQIHHRIPWRAGGRTDLIDLLPLCTVHHHLVHEGGWTIRRAAGMTFTFHPPEGVPPAREARADRAGDPAATRSGRLPPDPTGSHRPTDQAETDAGPPKPPGAAGHDRPGRPSGG